MVIIDIFKEQGVKSATFAILTFDKLHNITANMFQVLADTSDFDLMIEVFLSEGLSNDWMVEQIERDKN